MGISARARTGDSRLTPEQLAAVTSDARRITVRAGPGSGKTRVLVERVAQRVISDRLDLARTLAITFTENAAAEMKSRLAERFEQEGLEEQRRRLEWAYISTIHGFCARLLREHGIEAGVDPRFRVLDEVHSRVLQHATLDSVLQDWQRRHPARFLEFVRHFEERSHPRQERGYQGTLLDAYETVRRLGGDPENQAELLRPPELWLSPPQAELERCAAGHRESVAELLGELHRAYSEHKRHLSALDFDDLEEHTRRMLHEWPELARRISRRFQEILVDEYQDTSPAQSDIIQMLAAETRLFVVGDPAQSIYGFRNAEPKAFEAAWEQAGDDGQVDLRDDFRSRPEILRAVNRHFEPLGKPFSALKVGSRFVEKQAASVEILLVGTAGGKMDEVRPLEARHLAQRVRELIESRTLRITNRDSSRFGQELRYGDVALLFRSATDMKLYERALEDAGIPYFAETGRGFYGAREVRDVVSFLRVLDNSRNEIALAAVLRSPMFGLSDDALYLLAAQAHAVKGGVLADVLEEADAVPDLPAEDAACLREFRALLARLRAERPWRSLAEMVREIVRATGYDTTLLLESNGRRKVANLYKLAEVAASLESAGFGSLNDFCRAVDRFHFQEVREAEAQLDTAAEDAVRLMTMHAAKGLEFPVVVLPDLTRRAGPKAKHVEFLPGFGLGVKFADGGKPRETPTLENIRASLKEREQAEEQRVLFVAMTRAQEHLILSGCLSSTKKKGFVLHHALEEIRQSFGLPVKGVQADREWRTHRVGAGGESFEVALLATDEPLAAEAPQQASIARRYEAALIAGSPLGLPVEPQAEADAQRLAATALAPPPESDSTDFLAAVTDVLEFQRCPRRYYLGRYLGHDIGRIGILSQSGAGIPACQPSGAGILACHSLQNDTQDNGGEQPTDEFPRTEIGLAVHRLLAAGSGALDAVPESLRAEAELLAKRFRQSEYGGRTAAGDVRRELSVLASLDGHFLRGTLDLLSFENGRPELLLDYKANDIAARQVEEEAAHYRVQMLLYALLVEAAFGSLPREAVLFFLAPGVAHRVELTPAALEEARRVVAEFFAAQRTLSYPPRVADHCFPCPFNGTLCLAPQRELRVKGDE